MFEYLNFYIDGKWVAPRELKPLDVISPASETVCGRIALGSSVDVDAAVQAAAKAFGTWSQTSREERLDVLRCIASEYQKRSQDLAVAVTAEMGAPASFALQSQVQAGLGQILAAIEILQDFQFEEERGQTTILHEPIGVCGFITPWNWPLNQIVCKVAPALATGCTMVLKPSELAPLSAQIFAEIVHAAGVPAGVFNLVQGDGPGVGVALSVHPTVDMVSFTGSTRAGIEVARNAAPSVKRVHQELGGKSPNIVLDDEAFEESVARGVRYLMSNSGQTCSAPSRMIVPHHRMTEAIELAKQAAEHVSVGDPNGNFTIGPVVSSTQWQKIQKLIQCGIEEGATLVCGGLGRPEGLEKGFFVKPTVFANVTNDMTIAREEIFGPVLTILGYEDLDQAIAIGNDSEYGLAGYVSGVDLGTLRDLSRRLRAGYITVNDAYDNKAPFGGYKMSGNGRECGAEAFHEFLEVKAIIGYAPFR